MNTKKIVLAGSGCKDLANATAKSANALFGTVTSETFSDGETYINIQDDVTGADVFCFQSGCAPANTHLVELCMMIDAAKRASARRVIAVTPFYPYRRQDRIANLGESVAGEVVARCLETSGADEVVIVDLHHPRMREFFHVPLTELSAFPLFADHMKRHEDTSNMVILAPDEGSRRYTHHFVEELGLPLVQAFKTRTARDQATITRLEGDVRGKDVLIADDEVNTAGTLVANVEELQKMGAASMLFMATHPVLSGPAIERLSASSLKKILVTDTIPLSKEKQIPKIEVVSVVPLLSDYIKEYGNN